MAKDWFVQRDGRAHGPYNVSELKALLSLGRLSERTLVRHGKDRLWTTVDSEPELNALFCQAEQESEVVEADEAYESEGDGEPESFNCPKCGGDHTQKVSVVYEIGTTQSQSTSTMGGFAYSDGDFIPMGGRGTTKTQHQSSLAARFSPPSPPRVPIAWLPESLGVVLTFLFFLVFLVGVSDAIKAPSRLRAEAYVSATVGLVFAIGTGVCTHLRRMARNSPGFRDACEAYETKAAFWHRAFFCHRCGNVFDPSNR